MRDNIKQALKVALSRGYQLSPDAVDYLREVEDPLSLISHILTRAIPNDRYVIDRHMIERYLESQANKAQVGLASASEYDVDIKVLESPMTLNVDPSFDGFLRYFRDRYVLLSSLLRSRLDMHDAVPIAEAKKTSGEVCVIGLVYDKRSVTSSTILSIEDPSGNIDVLVPEDPKVKAQVNDIVLDICIGVRGVMRNGKLIAEEIILPEVVPPPPPREAPPISMLLLSDLHVGSSLFGGQRFLRLMRWLRGEEGNRRMKELALSVKYVIIAGDLIDGVGIYPGQEKELTIKDLSGQYKAVAEYLAQFPEHIRIIVIPGNHDATSPGLPYVPFFKEYAYPIYELDNVIVLPDPVLVSLHGVKVLISHGRSLDDLLSALPGATFSPEGVIKAMRGLLRFRHLAPIYGSRTLISPMGYDPLVIRNVPHVLHMGHVHICAVQRYKGVILANSGTWQEQTEYQLSMGISPTPYIVPLIRLDTLQVIMLDFH